MIPQPLFRVWLASLTLALAPMAAAAAPAHEFPAASSITRADELIGRLVETHDGEELGRVRNLAMDLPSGRISYVVIAVASFLIDDDLIAVEPGALRESADGGLVLESDAESLRSARRFSGRDWPLRADIVARAPQPQGSAGDAADATADALADVGARGSAVISDGTRTATLSAGGRSIREGGPDGGPASDAASSESRPSNAPEASGARAPGPSARAPVAGSEGDFARLDRDGNGTLDRAEIAHKLSPGDSYSAIDTNGDGRIQRAEYQAWLRGGNRQAAE